MKRVPVRLLLAWAGIATAISAAAAPIPPDEVVKSTTTRLQAVIHERQKEFKADPQKLYAVVDQVVVPHFDLKYIAQLILARNWKSATEDQRTRFQVAFKNMLLHTYADALVEYHDSIKAEWQPLRMAPDAKDVTVQSKLLRQSKPPVPIGFAMRLTGDEWKVYDIVIENLSLITNFRSQISSEVKKTGLEAVIQKLEGGQAIAPVRTGKSS